MFPDTYQSKIWRHYEMTQICKGVCDLKKVSSMPNNLRYKSGQKRCCLCDCYFYTEDNTCPCCATRLRTKPRNKRIWEQS